MDILRFIMSTPMEDGRPFSEVAELWQVLDFEGMLRCLYSCLLRPRGHDKTSSVARYVRAHFVLSRKRQMIYTVASDEEQGLILKGDLDMMLQNDPATSGIARSTKTEITLKHSPRSKIKVLTHDAPSAMGLRPSLIVCDEMGEWRKRDLWDALYTATGKVKNCGLVIISVPPALRTSILSEVMEIAKSDTSGRWFYSHRGQCASWIDPAWLQDQKKSLPIHVYKRLHEAVQTEGVGAWLTEEEIQGVFEPMPPGSGGPIAIGVDVGYTRDRSYVAVCQRDELSGLYVVLHLIGWTPRHGERVDLQEVETEVEAAAKTYQATVRLDPYQAVLMGQRLKSRGVDAREYSFSVGGRERLFGTLLDVIRRRHLRCRSDPELRAELLGLEVKPSIAGGRVDHKSSGFDDAVVAIGLALQALPELAPGDYFPEGVGERDMGSLSRGATWETLPSPSGVSGGPSIDRVKGDVTDGIDWRGKLW